MKQKKKSVGEIILTVVQFVFDLLSATYIASNLYSVILKHTNWPQPLNIALSAIAFLVYSSLYFLFAIYPGLVSKKNVFSKKMEKHSISFLIINFFIVIAIVTLNSNIAYNKDDLKDLLGLEWAIYGITIGLFTIWEAIITSKNEEIDDPDDHIGFKRLEKIRNVQLKRILNSSSTFTVILLVLNTLAIVFFSTFMHMISHEKIQSLIVKMSIISFYFCVNSLVIIFAECLIPMFISKFLFNLKYNDRQYDDEELNLKTAIEEEAKFSAKKIALELTKQENADQILDDFEKEIIKKRKNKDIEAAVDKVIEKNSDGDQPDDDKKQSAENPNG